MFYANLMETKSDKIKSMVKEVKISVTQKRISKLLKASNEGDEIFFWEIGNSREHIEDVNLAMRMICGNNYTEGMKIETKRMQDASKIINKILIKNVAPIGDMLMR